MVRKLGNELFTNWPLLHVWIFLIFRESKFSIIFLKLINTCKVSDFFDKRIKLDIASVIINNGKINAITTTLDYQRWSHKSRWSNSRGNWEEETQLGKGSLHDFPIVQIRRKFLELNISLIVPPYLVSISGKIQKCEDHERRV